MHVCRCGCGAGLVHLSGATGTSSGQGQGRGKGCTSAQADMHLTQPFMPGRVLWLPPGGFLCRRSTRCVAMCANSTTMRVLFIWQGPRQYMVAGTAATQGQTPQLCSGAQHVKQQQVRCRRHTQTAFRPGSYGPCAFNREGALAGQSGVGCWKFCTYRAGGAAVPSVFLASGCWGLRLLRSLCLACTPPVSMTSTT
jgi:hypothetical protein